MISGEVQHYMSASKSDTSSVHTITPSEEKNHHRKTRKLSASTPLSADAPKRRSSSTRPTSVASDCKAPLPTSRKRLNKTAAKFSTGKQNSLDSYFSLAQIKDERTGLADDPVNADVETSREPPINYDVWTRTPPRANTMVVDTFTKTSPTFNETRTKIDKLGKTSKELRTSPILSMSMNIESERGNSALMRTSSLPKASSRKKTSQTAPSQLRKDSKSSLGHSSHGDGVDDDVFEDYFLSTTKSTRRQTLSLNFSPEKDPNSPFEVSTKPAKRKRGKNECEEALSKKRKPAPLNAFEFLAESSGLSSPSENVASPIPMPRSCGRRKSVQKQPASSGKDSRRRKSKAFTDADNYCNQAGDEDKLTDLEHAAPADARLEHFTLTFPKPPLTSQLTDTRSRKGSQSMLITDLID